MAELLETDWSVEQLRAQLDDLWEKHLTLLDTYHKAQQQLARHFSSAFFDLAQANFKSTNRLRYGQDSYDERMQATRRLLISLDDQHLPVLTTSSPLPPSISTKANPQQPTPPSTPPIDTGNQTPPIDTDNQTREEKDQELNDTPESENKESSSKKLGDPLHWFGILVPPALRSSQKSFISAFDGPIIDATNSAQALRHVTLEIRRLRKLIKRAEKRPI
jgi:hypothetical protein